MLALVHTIRQTTPRLPYALQTGYRPIVRGKEKAKVEFGGKPPIQRPHYLSAG